ncbi:deoxyguanosinetriphosphate triphosphohydrolase [Lachnotalea sp. AF33-28]|uniref:deoxyguanosinetriphosphate triphosphohydrolase n=1 Tax=Lachnotalea sp. AF33-28 TaxID=2292046 RepID=UPI000E491A7C|nr:deoxyguanosinetriphosphate triphosphohydrolase [Lachnotalea sp. AF33-28]RHP31956.1 deoxyguanosinetriphosphate triphosphohydrolase [Lachnotalea sp. AF33-28]
MHIREMLEEREKTLLSPYASYSCDAVREREEVPCDIRPAYQRDRDRIIHSKAFRRLKDKTQVFLVAEGDHYRNRLTHTLEVAQLARTIAKSLRLNEELTEAIGYGHDLGHTPFGHSGEDALDQALTEYGTGHRFRHYMQSVRVVEKLEKEGRGLNLTWAVRDGIKNHGTSGRPSTLEGKVVRLCDKIAYVNHDIDDAIRGGVLTEAELPREYTDILGHTVRDRLNALIHDIITNSQDKPDIIQSPHMAEAMTGLRTFMFERVYRSPLVKAEESKAKNMLRNLFDYYIRYWQTLPSEYVIMITEGQVPKEIVVCDYIAGMTDHYSMTKFEELFVPKSWNR